MLISVPDWEMRATVFSEQNKNQNKNQNDETEYSRFIMEAPQAKVPAAGSEINQIGKSVKGVGSVLTS